MTVKPRIAVINYGVGNLRSIVRGLQQAGAEARTTENIRDIPSFDAVVFPGVGAFGSAMKILSTNQKTIKAAIRRKMPFLGICLGMQVLFTESEESKVRRGMGIIPGKVIKLVGSVKVPHMGWNTLRILRVNPLVRGISGGDYFYFVHSYISKPKDSGVVLATTKYGSEFPSIVAKGNVYGVQFHPEKSGENGLRILSNFVGIVKGGLSGY